jgi:hypothetical protein
MKQAGSKPLWKLNEFYFSPKIKIKMAIPEISMNTRAFSVTAVVMNLLSYVNAQ